MMPDTNVLVCVGFSFSNKADAHFLSLSVRKQHCPCGRRGVSGVRWKGFRRSRVSWSRRREQIRKGKLSQMASFSH